METRLVMLMALLSFSCAGGYRVGVGPHIDTDGHVGLMVTAGLSGGIALNERSTFEPVVEVATGPEFDRSDGTFAVATGFDYLRASRPGQGVAFRVGARMRAHLLYGEDRRLFGPGVAAAVLARLKASGRYRHLGGEVSAFIVEDPSEGRFDQGLFTLGLVFEERWINPDVLRNFP